MADVYLSIVWRAYKSLYMGDAACTAAAADTRPHYGSLQDLYGLLKNCFRSYSP